MTNFLPLFKEPQTIVFDLGNLLTDVLDGTFHVTLTAVYFTAADSIMPADLILPVSKQQGASGQPSFWSVPGDIASSELSLPRNIKKAVFTVAATGQATEEVMPENSYLKSHWLIIYPAVLVEQRPAIADQHIRVHDWHALRLLTFPRSPAIH